MADRNREAAGPGGSVPWEGSWGAAQSQTALGHAGDQAGPPGGQESRRKPGIPCESSGREGSRRISPKEFIRSKAAKTNITSRNKPGALLFLLFGSLQQQRERSKLLPALHWVWACLPIHWANAAQQWLCKVQQRMKRVMRTTLLRL